MFKKKKDPAIHVQNMQDVREKTPQDSSNFFFLFCFVQRNTVWGFFKGNAA